MFPLNRLIYLQASFAILAMSYLCLSGFRLATHGKPLSAAPIAASFLLFGIYSGCLLLPKRGMKKSYRIAMAAAIVASGGGGVLGNIRNILENGLTDYANLSAFIIAVLINSYGTLLNIAAVAGWYTLPAPSPASARV